jgi:molecular chaperone GrpE
LTLEPPGRVRSDAAACYNFFVTDDLMDNQPSAAETGTEAAEVDELTELRRELAEKQDRYLRALAEMENAKRRAQRDRDEYIKYANESLIRDLLPVLDNFDRALDAARASGEPSTVVEGVELIQRELLKVLERFGVERYSALGAAFDPTRHEAVSRVITAEHPENTVIGETLRGYLLNGRVLRPAMVAVAAAPDEAT